MLQKQSRDAKLQTEETAKTRQILLDAMIRDAIMTTMAKRSGLDKTAFIKKLLTSELVVSDKEAADYLNTHSKEFTGQSHAKEFAHATVQRKKFEAWLDQTKASIPIKVDESAVNSLDLSKP